MGEDQLDCRAVLSSEGSYFRGRGQWLVSPRRRCVKKKKARWSVSRPFRSSYWVRDERGLIGLLSQLSSLSQSRLVGCVLWSITLQDPPGRSNRELHNCMRPEREALKLAIRLTALPLSPHKLDISALGAATSAGHHGINTTRYRTMTSVVVSHLGGR